MKIQNKVQFFSIKKDEIGQRVDNFLLSHLKGVPRSRIYHIIRKGQIRINGGRVKPRYKIQIDDVIRIPPIHQEIEKESIIINQLDKASVLANSMVYEDEHLLVLNKPAGIAVHGGSGVNVGIIESLRALHHKENFLELVHRLDRDTSGILVIAKKRSALRELHHQLRLKQMKKEYIALVKGKWPSYMKSIKAPLSKSVLKSGKRIVKVSSHGKYSETHFKVEKRFSNATLLKVIPITGRTHQIRVHARYANHPIGCDSRYGDVDFDQQLILFGLKRLFLHASSLMFIHPVSGKKLTFKALLDKQLRNCLALLS